MKDTQGELTLIHKTRVLSRTQMVVMGFSSSRRNSQTKKKKQPTLLSCENWQVKEEAHSLPAIVSKAEAQVEKAGS